MKTFNGIVVSTKMKDTVVVEVTRRVPHPLYKKLLKKSARFKVHSPNASVKEGDMVTIVETKPVSKDKHFTLFEKPMKKTAKSGKEKK